MHTNRSQGAFTNKTYLDQCLSYVYTQLETAKAQTKPGGTVSSGPAITISYQAGAGAHEIAVRLAGILQSDGTAKSALWTVFDRHLVEKVLEEHQMPQSLAKYIPEDRQSSLRKVMDQMFGVIPSAWDMVPKIAETVLHLADAGHVILVGRGANFITANLPNVFHVRLIGSLSKRIEHERELHQLTLEQATESVNEEDRARGRYVRENFGVGIEDDLLYHIVINTDRISPTHTAQLIVEGARKGFQAATD